MVFFNVGEVIVFRGIPLVLIVDLRLFRLRQLRCYLLQEGLSTAETSCSPPIK